MPRTGRGGKRQGTPGKLYSNRTDLSMATQPVKTVPNQPYGEAGKQAAAQRAMPLPDNASMVSTSAPAGPLPGELGAFDRGTERPTEPLMAGVSMGAGPGPEVLSTPNSNDIPTQLRALYRMFPNKDLLDLIEHADSDREFGL